MLRDLSSVQVLGHPVGHHEGLSHRRARVCRGGSSLVRYQEATCKFETRDMVGIHEPFLGQYQARVRLLLKERSWGPVFLYSKDGQPGQQNHGSQL